MILFGALQLAHASCTLPPSMVSKRATNCIIPTPSGIGGMANDTDMSWPRRRDAESARPDAVVLYMLCESGPRDWGVPRSLPEIEVRGGLPISFLRLLTNPRIQMGRMPLRKNFKVVSQCVQSGQWVVGMSACLGLLVD